MYAIRANSAPVRRRHPTESLLWRARWGILGLAALALLGAAYARAASSSPVGSHELTTAYEAVTVAPGDTLWGIASRRYPGTDVRKRVFEIERANGLHSPAIEPGQQLRVPVR